jgi:hypothetical protein
MMATTANGGPPVGDSDTHTAPTGTTAPDTAVAGAEKLSSNVMNYLVWRYLQESGYGKTAKQLQYQWMGREASPEQLPFAQNIKKSCLIHLAQDGLLLDCLQAEVKKVCRVVPLYMLSGKDGQGNG